MTDGVGVGNDEDESGGRSPVGSGMAERAGNDEKRATDQSPPS